LSKKKFVLKICLLGSNPKLNLYISRAIGGVSGDTPLGILPPVFQSRQYDYLEKMKIKIMIPAISPETISNEKVWYQTILNSSGCLVIYECANQSDFDAISTWIQRFREISGDLSYPIAIVGVQTRKKDDCNQFNAIKLANELKVDYYIIGHMERPKLMKIFEDITQKALRIKNCNQQLKS